MIVHAALCGYYDWAPCPPGTKITEEDVRCHRAKQVTTDAWHMRVEKSGETHNDCNIPELVVCTRMAALEKLGRPQSREAVIADLLRHTYEHHLDASRHLVEIVAHDSGPVPELYAQALESIGVVGDAQKVALSRYEDSADMTQYLNVVFKTQASRGSK